MNPTSPKSNTSLRRFIDGSARGTPNNAPRPTARFCRQAMAQINEILESLEDDNSPNTGHSRRSTNIARDLAVDLLGLGHEKPVKSSSNLVQALGQPQLTPCGKHIVPANVPLISRKDEPTDDAMDYFMATQNHFITSETEFMVDPESVGLCINRTSPRTDWHRNVMLDWIIKAQGVLELDDSTLFLAANIFDRCFSRDLVTPKNLTLVGITSLWLAHKHEVRRPKPIGKKYEGVFEQAVSKTQIIGMESKILDTIDHKLIVPTSYTFLMRLLYIMRLLNGEEKENLKETAQFLITLALINTAMLKYRPSIIAAAAIQLSADMNDIYLPWDGRMEYYSGWKYSHIEQCANDMEKMWIARNKLSSPFQQLIAIQEKFKPFFDNDTTQKTSNQN